MKLNLNEKEQRIWNNAKDCKCGKKDCTVINHKLCAICNKKMLRGAHASIESQKNSKFSWNIDHIIPKAKNGSNQIENLQAVHVGCNNKKANN